MGWDSSSIPPLTVHACRSCDRDSASAVESTPLVKEAVKQKLRLDVIHTGQHYDYELSRVFFDELGLPDPAVNLGVGSGSHGEQTGRMLIELEKTYRELGPDVVLVPGDTDSTLAGALAAVKMGVPTFSTEKVIGAEVKTLSSKVFNFGSCTLFINSHFLCRLIS